MDETKDTGFEEFRAAFSDGDYQNASSEDAADTEAEQEVTDDTFEDHSEEESSEATGDDSAEDEDTNDSEDNGADGDEEDEGGNTDADQTFTPKVNKEERKVTLEEMTTLAQKGADYDRVKEQNTRHQQTIADLQSKLESVSSQQNALDILGNIAQKSNLTLDQLSESLYINFRKNAGVSEDVAREELRSAKLEKELDSYKAKQTQQQEQETDAEARAQRDLEEFGREYPGVELTEELVDKLVPDIQNGMSLSAAYRKYEKAQDSARIAELERQLAAEKQNNRNKRRSPGSQKDAGANAKKTDFDEFAAAFR